MFLGIKKWIYSEFLLKILKQYDSSYHYFLPPQGLGDILFVLMYIREFRKKNPFQKIAIIVTKNHFLNLAKIFSEEIDLILKLDLSLLRSNQFYQFHYLYQEIYNPDFSTTNLLSACRRALGLDANSTYFIPKIEYDSIIVKKLEKLVHSKVALIAPDAVSCSRIINDREWEELASFLQSNNYTVYFNIPQKRRFRKFSHLFLSIEEIIMFCNKIPLFIGYRSGLCDVIAAFCNCKQFIYYPNNKKQGEFNCIKDYDKNPNLAYLKYCSLKKMFPDKMIYEVIYRKESFFKDFKEFFYG